MGKKQKPATQAERNAIEFDAYELDIDLSKVWRERETTINVLLKVLAYDHKELEAFYGRAIKTGAANDSLDFIYETREFMKTLQGLCDLAMTRSFLVLERLGYSPENPPPDNPA